MKEIITKILQEEEVTRTQVERARAEAAETVARARGRGAAMVEAALAEAKAEAQKRREEAMRVFIEEKGKIITETKRQAAEARGKREQDIPRMARQIFSRVIETGR